MAVPVNRNARRVGGDPAPTDADLRRIGDGVIGITIENAMYDMLGSDRAMGEDPRTGHYARDRMVRDWTDVLRAVASEMDSKYPLEFHALDILRAIDIKAVTDTITPDVRTRVVRLLRR
jgi:hypothetical protein